MIVDVKDASSCVFHSRRFCSWSISAYQHEPVCAITSRTRGEVVFSVGFSGGAHEIFIDGLGAQQALLTSPSHIIRMEGITNMRANAADAIHATVAPRNGSAR